MSKILLTGGLGYIGSHVAVELGHQGYDIVIVDDLSNSERFVLDRISELVGKEVYFEEGDIRDEQFLTNVLSKHEIAGVIHLAAKKAVGESMEKPLLYYDVNVTGLIILLKVIQAKKIRKLIFSSSCTVYGSPDHLPVTESTPFGMTPSPYGKTKQMCEQMLESLSGSGLQITSLRYFNPVGAHPSGRIGELPKGIPNNLVPFITQTAAGIRDELQVFGGDYDTPDGSAIRDYIHVTDVAKAHVQALNLNADYTVLNIGTGRGHTVLEVISTFEQVANVPVAYRISPRREGDIERIYADTSTANQVLDWKAEMNLEDMLRDAWKWQTGLIKS